MEMKFLNTGLHFEPLRPQRALGAKAEGKYEFTHGARSVCVYDIDTLDFVKEIPVGTKPDCHATSPDNRFLYIACLEGIYVISQATLEVVKIVDTGKVYATNVLPDGNTLLVHDLCGGIILIKDICDMDKIHIHKRVQVIPDGVFRCEIGGKGNFICDGKYYLCAGWLQSKLYLFDVENDFVRRNLAAIENAVGRRLTVEDAGLNRAAFVGGGDGRDRLRIGERGGVAGAERRGVRAGV